MLGRVNCCKSAANSFLHIVFPILQWVLLHSHAFSLKFNSRGGKYSGLAHAEICKKYRESMTEAKKEKDRIRKQRWRQNLKKNPAKYNEYLEKERLWKNYSNLTKSQKSLASSSSNSQTPDTSDIRASEEVSGKQKDQFYKMNRLSQPNNHGAEVWKRQSIICRKAHEKSRDYSKFEIEIPNTKYCFVG